MAWRTGRAPQSGGRADKAARSAAITSKTPNYGICLSKESIRGLKALEAGLPLQ